MAPGSCNWRPSGLVRPTESVVENTMSHERRLSDFSINYIRRERQFLQLVVRSRFADQIFCFGIFVVLACMLLSGVLLLRSRNTDQSPTPSGTLLGAVTLAPLPTPKVIGAPVYPLKRSKDGRRLVDQRGVPFLLVGDSPQALIANLPL